ncbi:MAG: MaoC family dehydratase N-terminal domain-containing protein [Gammaproteobacteria bacterium]|nr:MaoC family dehydratase N-terminal domain-containing protein [Gammaproteobacteria bacterium]
MSIDPSKVGLEGEPRDRAWDSKDCLLYAVGVGCGTDELEFATEKDQKVLPTFAVIIGGGGVPLNKIGDFNFAMLVHGEQAIYFEKPIPTEGIITSQGKIVEIWDKGSGAVIVTESNSIDKKTGELIFKTRSSVFLRGEGGFGGDRGPKAEKFNPGRAPDKQITYKTREDQALTYRLSGDRNPLHSDPEFAKRGGFDRPILHGLCTYGFTGRALLNSYCKDQPEKFKAIEGRFSKPVMPGDELTISMWQEGNNVLFQTKTQDDVVVIDNGLFKFED